MTIPYSFWLNAWKDADLEHIEKRIQDLGKELTTLNSNIYRLNQEKEALWELKAKKEGGSIK